MGAVHRMADELGISDRTLRRGVGLGLVRGVYLNARGLYLAPGEMDYLRRQWTTLDRLRRALRNEPVVQFALLYGAGARRSASPRSGPETLRLLLETSEVHVTRWLASTPSSHGRCNSRSRSPSSATWLISPPSC